jgi:glycerophosphoryl diester phosphodiesterase
MAKWHPAFGIGPWIASNHLAAVEVDADEASAEAFRAFHALGVKVQTKNLDRWDNPGFWDQSIDAGADWVQTDLPEELASHRLWQRVKRRPVGISLHRGANRYLPENTIPAFEKGIRMGVDYVEFDVRTTRDGKYYLLHDRILDGKTDGTGPIAETSSDVVSKLSAGVKFGRAHAGVRMPTLEEFMETVAGRVNLYFDAKAIPPEALAESVARHRMEERTVVYQSPEYLLRLKAINPRIRALPPLRSASDLDPLAASLKPYGVDVDWELLSGELIARCHALGIRVFSDALGKHERIGEYLKAIEWGIDVIQTDHPLRVMRAIELHEGIRRDGK